MNQNYVYCQRCGSPSQAGSQFCQNCGSPLQAEALPPTQSPANQQGIPPAYAYPGYVPPQQPKKSDKMPWIILGLVLVIAVAVIAVLMLVVLPGNNAKQAEEQTAVALQNKQQATSEAAAARKTLDAAIQQTLEAVPTVPPVPTKAILPTQSGSTMYDYNSLSLDANDFPPGFDILTEDEANSMGFGVDAMSSSLSAFTSADPVFSTTALLMNGNEFELAFAMVAAPLSPTELNAFLNEISNPDVAKASFSSGLGGDAEIWPDAGYFGDTSIGFTYSLDSGGVLIYGDVVVVVRGEAMFMIMSMWLDSSTSHQVDSLYLAQRLDDQIYVIQH